MWAIIHLMGRRRTAGRVHLEGGGVVTAWPLDEGSDTGPGWVTYGPGAVYDVIPCTEQQARIVRAIEEAKTCGRGDLVADADVVWQEWAEASGQTVLRCPHCGLIACVEGELHEDSGGVLALPPDNQWLLDHRNGAQGGRGMRCEACERWSDVSITEDGRPCLVDGRAAQPPHVLEAIRAAREIRAQQQLDEYSEIPF